MTGASSDAESVRRRTVLATRISLSRRQPICMDNYLFCFLLIFLYIWHRFGRHTARIRVQTLVCDVIDDTERIRNSQSNFHVFALQFAAKHSYDQELELYVEFCDNKSFESRSTAADRYARASYSGLLALLTAMTLYLDQISVSIRPCGYRNNR